MLVLEDVGTAVTCWTLSATGMTEQIEDVIVGSCSSINL